MLHTSLAVLLLQTLAACSAESELRPGESAGNAAGSAAGGTSSAGPGGSAQAGEMAAAGKATAGAAGAASLLEAPDEAGALAVFLEAKSYSGWANESEYHASAGPHGDGVRIFYSPKAAASLRNGAATFPAGAAVVKELSSAGNLYGHAVWVKVQDDSDAGNGFYWYEVIHAEAGDNVYGDALGSSDCVPCHKTGKDYLLATLPFE